MSAAVSVTDVLAVLAEFDPFGGASLELAAWELDQDLAAVAPAWSQAIRAGLLEPGENDRASGEQMWRLRTRGRPAGGTADEAS